MTGERKEIADGHYRKLKSIQGLRGVAFLLIFLSHTEMVIAGALGAELFLVISGFVMMLAYNEKDKTLQTGKIINGIEFSASKINRLYPLHMFMLVGIAIVVWMQLLMGEASADIFISQMIFFLFNALLIQSWIPNSEAYFSYNAVSWYLSVCTFLYFLFPWTLKKLKRKSKHSLIGILIGDGIIRIGLALIVYITPNQNIIIGGGVLNGLRIYAQYTDLEIFYMDVF